MAALNLYRCLIVIALYWMQITSQATQIPKAQGYDCSDIWKQNKKSPTGIYTIKPKGTDSAFKVFCEMTATGGWTMIQKHTGEDGLSFQQMWEDYEDGFGKLTGEHWLGLRNIYSLTNQKNRPSVLRISIGDFSGNEAYAEYRPFSIGNDSELYRLSAGDYSGTAGDGFLGDVTINGTRQHGSYFSTPDRPNDNCHPMCAIGDIRYPSCSYIQESGWWFNSCGFTNLNGGWRSPPTHMFWASSVSWPTWRPFMSLKFSKMFLIHD